MTQEEKNLLIEDFCGRILHEVKFHYTKHPASVVDQDVDDTACGYYCGLVVGYHNDYCIERCKPYLRPMSSMTEEEKKELQNVIISNPITPYGELTNKCDNLTLYCAYGASLVKDCLFSRHFDVLGLIPKGLALEAPEDMYK